MELRPKPAENERSSSPRGVGRDVVAGCGGRWDLSHRRLLLAGAVWRGPVAMRKPRRRCGCRWRSGRRSRTGWRRRRRSPPSAPGSSVSPSPHEVAREQRHQGYRAARADRPATARTARPRAGMLVDERGCACMSRMSSRCAGLRSRSASDCPSTSRATRGCGFRARRSRAVVRADPRVAPSGSLSKLLARGEAAVFIGPLPPVAPSAPCCSPSPVRALSGRRAVRPPGRRARSVRPRASPTSERPEATE
jgi:hypothetical protein